jgi:signal transduction histidine kinase/GAF domain-containing protein
LEGRCETQRQVHEEAEIQTHLQEDTFSIVERVARIVSNVRGTKTDYAHLASELAPVFPFDLFGVVLLRHDRQAVRVIVCTREAGRWVSHYHQHPLADSMLERFVGQTMEDVLVEMPVSPAQVEGAVEREMVVRIYPGGVDGSPAECGDALSGYPRLRATLIAPLQVGERVIGALELGSADVQAYADAHTLRIIHAVVQVLAAAIESAQVGGNVEIQDRQREELQKVSSALASTMDLPTILHRIVDGIAKALNVASAIVTVERASGKLRLDAQHGMDIDKLRDIMYHKQTLSETSIIGATLRRRQPLVSNDIAQDVHFSASHVLASGLGMRSIFCYPLVVGSTAFGVLLLLSPEPGGFTPLKADILSLFANQATIAVHQGMLLESTRQRQRFQNAIKQLERMQPQELASDEELLLLKKVREEMEQNFGISFSNLLRIISDHLLTRGERNLQSIWRTNREDAEEVSRPADNVQATLALLQERLGDAEQAVSPQEQDAAALMQTVEVALARAGLLGNVGAALTGALDPGRVLAQGGASAIPRLYEQVTRSMQDPWLIVDLHGQCIYVNPAAEALCGIRLDFDAVGRLSMLTRFFESEQSADAPHGDMLRLQEALASLLPRIRNSGEVRAYLSEFERPDIVEQLAAETPKQMVENYSLDVGVPRLNPLPTHTLRCIIAAEEVHPFRPGGTGERARLETLDRMLAGRDNPFRSMTLDNAPSDRHYQLMRYALYDPRDVLIAHALQIHDITDQVRDERNKSALLSSVSHDLRTPLTAIKAAVSGLLQPGVRWDERVRHEMLVDIDMEADHLHSLINSMVEMSRIEMGALTLEKEWCDLVEIAHTALAHIHRAVAGLQIQTDFEARLPLVFVDYLQMQRVFANLLENAARYTPQDHAVLITARTVSFDASGNTTLEGIPRYLRVSVVDHGRGVPEDERERIFKSFYSRDGHTGLGLAICRGIIEAHQGRIWVEPAGHGGACFVFVLPVSV